MTAQETWQRWNENIRRFDAIVRKHEQLELECRQFDGCDLERDWDRIADQFSGLLERWHAFNAELDAAEREQDSLLPSMLGPVEMASN